MRQILKNHTNVASRYLKIGEGGIYRKPTAVQTVLGSCVSVTFHVPAHGLGAMFHAFMPNPLSDADRVSERYKFVSTAVETVVSSLVSNGVHRRQIECKVFGGANALLEGEYGVGKKNARQAFEALEHCGLSVLVSSIGGTRGRKILFLTHTGEVFLKYLDKRSSLAA